MIPEKVLKQLRYIEIYTAKKFRNMKVGNYTSPLLGPGVEFHDHRAYRPGDDVRTIDWNVTARSNRPFIKQTQSERELNVLVVIDLSGSIDFGTGQFSKKEVMTFVTGSLLFSALSDQINIGFLAFADEVLSYAPPRARTRGGAWAILENLWSLNSKAERTKILPAVRQAGRKLKNKSIIFLVSDFLTEEEIFQNKEFKELAVKHDVIAVVLEDPAETSLPGGGGYVHIRDMETAEELTIRLNGQLGRMFTANMERRRQDLSRSFYRAQIDHVFVRSDQSYLDPLLQLFMNRKNQ